MTLSRRNLLTAAAGTLVPFAPGVNVSFGATPGAQNNVLVFLFLRFGMDGLQLLAPADDGTYRDKRRTIGLRGSADNSGRQPIGTLDRVPLYLNPQAGQLRLMYQNQTHAFIHAAGTPTGLRSHFEVKEMVDKGLADGDHDNATGWLARHLSTRTGTNGDFAATADVSVDTTALRGTPGTVPTSSLEGLGSQLTSDRAALIAAMNTADNAVAQSARLSLDTVAAVQRRSLSIPAQQNPNYTNGPLSQKLRPLARVLKLDLGVEIATVDFGGWDHHDHELQYFSQQVQELSDALFAFTDDLGDAMKRVTVVAMTEFGRRVQENANGGTDHGAGSVMMVLGGGVNGGQIYGLWPGLADAQLDQGDLAVTTDYRRVLAEVLVKRQNQQQIASVFPTVPYAPLGIIRGT